MATRDSNEFKYALRDIAAHAPKLSNPYDRVRCSEWARKLASLPDDNLEACKVKNEYAQFLRIQVRNNFLHGPFMSPPPETATLSPLAENLGNMMSQQIPYLPRTGPIAPMLHHGSPDGRAFVSTKQIPGGGVLCYMAVSPEGFD
ncbi:hypothetical protein PPYR_13111 [Photinus pyralis]|uniref:DUF4485 domain-containing protein n=1 Tax=Photinus pyralis TaxID=7054 RepID=A0A1Y1LGY8_PHOPY|nr:uncharacterized protein LOC116178650 [Photinus pyralis]KAB0793491.1 hypothetical protein PPYR_13111 [Photinus pyralis]